MSQRFDKGKTLPSQDSTSRPETSPTAHDVTEVERLLRSRRYGDILRSQPDLVQAANQHLAPVIASGEANLGQQLWHALLCEPLDVIIRCMTADDAEGRLLRSANPFSIVIGQSMIGERRKLWREAKAMLGRSNASD